LIFAADHGNDPTDGSTDHTREYVPLLVAGLNAAGVDLGIRSTYADVAATVCDGLGIPSPIAGTSFLKDIT
jgi:phosphopentomutase